MSTFKRGWAAVVFFLTGNVAAQTTPCIIGSLQIGMTYEQAVEVIGASGEEASLRDADSATATYSWKNPNGSNLNLMFKEGALISKLQFGLR